MLDRARKFAKANPAQAAAIAVGAGTLAWLLWPKKRAQTFLPPPPPPKPAPAPAPAPAPPSGLPRLPGNTPRAKEANLFLDRVDALKEGETYPVPGDPRGTTYTITGPYFVDIPRFIDNRERDNSVYYNRRRETLAEAKDLIYWNVLTGRAAFSADNTDGCWRGLCGQGNTTFRCNRDGSTPPVGSWGPVVVPSFVNLTNGLKEARLKGTRRYSDGSWETVVLAEQVFQVPLPRAYGPNPSEPSGGVRSPGTCQGAPCGPDRCGWVMQDQEVWAALGVPLFNREENA